MLITQFDRNRYVDKFSTVLGQSAPCIRRNRAKRSFEQTKVKKDRRNYFVLLYFILISYLNNAALNLVTSESINIIKMNSWKSVEKDFLFGIGSENGILKLY